MKPWRSRLLLPLVFLVLLRLTMGSGVLTAARASDAVVISDGKAALAFRPAGSNEFTFDTGVLQGRLRAKGRSTGLSSVMYSPTGTRLDASMGLLSHYRLFSAGRRYGTAAWDSPSEAILAPDGRVSVRWPASAERPFELGVTYRWATPNALDVETRVSAQTNLARFESFLASYWSPAFSNSLVAVGNLPATREGKALMAAQQSAGQWLAFPRDDSAADIIHDGRWKLPPNPVDWTVMPRMAYPLGVRRAPSTGVTALLMSPATDCFAICTPFQDEGHYSMYLSLFGRDLKPNDTARARVRLLIAPGLTDAQILKTYETYARECLGH